MLNMPCSVIPHPLKFFGEELDQSDVSRGETIDFRQQRLGVIVVRADRCAKPKDESVHAEQTEKNDRADKQRNFRLCHLIFVPVNVPQKKGAINGDQREKHGRGVKRVDREKETELAQE